MSEHISQHNPVVFIGRSEPLVTSSHHYLSYENILGGAMYGTQEFVNIIRGYCYFAESALHIHNRLQWQVNQFQVG